MGGFFHPGSDPERQRRSQRLVYVALGVVGPLLGAAIVLGAAALAN